MRDAMRDMEPWDKESLEPNIGEARRRNDLSNTCLDVLQLHHLVHANNKSSRSMLSNIFSFLTYRFVVKLYAMCFVFVVNGQIAYLEITEALTSVVALCLRKTCSNKIKFATVYTILWSFWQMFY